MTWEHSRAATKAITAIGPGAVDAVPALVAYYQSKNGAEPRRRGPRLDRSGRQGCRADSGGA